MASSRLSLLCLLPFFITTFNAAATTKNTITVPLSPFTTKHASSDPYKILNLLVASSLSRARHVKSKTKTNSSSNLETPLFSHSYGGYSISLSFGTPPQTVPLIFDTGSSLVWLPCTSQYVCINCNFTNVEPSKVPVYFPKRSSSVKLVDCGDQKCGWIFGSDVNSRCLICNPKNQNCTETCPSYGIQYGLGFTSGRLLSETLDFPHKKVPNFLVGCSLISIHAPAGTGIAGFGRTPESLPSQLGLKKFSYCLLSRKFDDTRVSSNLVLDTGSGSVDSKTPSLSYTPFHKNPSGLNPAFEQYYYVGLRKIIVGNEHVKVPFKYLVPGSGGNGGTIVDSGSTFTFMARPVFEAVVKEFTKQMSNYSRAADVEKQTGLTPCFKISHEKRVSPPGLIFQFEGGAKMALPVENYFFRIKSDICLTLVTDNSTGGPAITLGSFQLQNYQVEFDLANDRFGFAKKTCP